MICEMKLPGYIRSSNINPIFLMFSPYFYDIYICHLVKTAASEVQCLISVLSYKSPLQSGNLMGSLEHDLLHQIRAIALTSVTVISEISEDRYTVLNHLRSENGLASYFS